MKITPDYGTNMNSGEFNNVQSTVSNLLRNGSDNRVVAGSACRASDKYR